MALVVKSSPANAGDTKSHGFIPGSKRCPGKPTLLFLPGESHGERRLADYST